MVYVAAGSEGAAGADGGGLRLQRRLSCVLQLNAAF